MNDIGGREGTGPVGTLMRLYGYSLLARQNRQEEELGHGTQLNLGVGRPGRGATGDQPRTLHSDATT